MVDMRWGIQDTARNDHTTFELCLREIETCKRLSVGPSFLVSTKSFSETLERFFFFPGRYERSSFSTPSVTDFKRLRDSDVMIPLEYFGFLDGITSCPLNILSVGHILILEPILVFNPWPPTCSVTS